MSGPFVAFILNPSGGRVKLPPIFFKISLIHARGQILAGPDYIEPVGIQVASNHAFEHFIREDAEIEYPKFTHPTSNLVSPGTMDKTIEASEL